jgi:hypothetical protein
VGAAARSNRIRCGRWGEVLELDRQGNHRWVWEQLSGMEVDDEQ